MTGPQERGERGCPHLHMEERHEPAGPATLELRAYWYCLDCDERVCRDCREIVPEGWFHGCDCRSRAATRIPSTHPRRRPMPETTIERLVAADRRLHPEVWERIDRIAEIIAPEAFPGEAWDGTGPDARRITWDDNPRVQYAQSVARNRAMEILRYLGLTPGPTDWPALFAEAGFMEPQPPQETTDAT